MLSHHGCLVREAEYDSKILRRRVQQFIEQKNNTESPNHSRPKTLPDLSQPPAKSIAESMTQYRVVILGINGIGKSSLAIRMVQDDFVEDACDPTLEESYRIQITVDEEDCILDITDTSSPDGPSQMMDELMYSGQVFLFAYDITSCASFEILQSFHDQVVRAKGVETFPMVLVGNRSDLDGAREVTGSTAQAMADKFQCPRFETSAKLGDHVQDAFFQLVRELRKPRNDIPARNRRPCILM